MHLHHWDQKNGVISSILNMSGLAASLRVESANFTNYEWPWITIHGNKKTLSFPKSGACQDWLPLHVLSQIASPTTNDHASPRIAWKKRCQSVNDDYGWTGCLGKSFENHYGTKLLNFVVLYRSDFRLSARHPGRPLRHPRAPGTSRMQHRYSEITTVQNYKIL